MGFRTRLHLHQFSATKVTEENWLLTTDSKEALYKALYKGQLTTKNKAIVMDTWAFSADFDNLWSSFILCYIKRARRSTWFKGFCLQLSYNATTSKNKLPVYSCSLLLCNTILGKSMSDRIEHGVGIMENQKISGKIFDLWYDLITKGPCLIRLLVLG